MPYIKKENRKKLDIYIKNLNAILGEMSDKNVGDYTYVVYKLLKDSVKKNKYFKFALVMGLLQSVDKELYRRIVSKYENEKIKQNGDVE